MKLANMKRPDREITNRNEIDKIIHACDVCHLAFAINGDPYVVPVSYGYDGNCLYFHTAREGKKIDFIAANPKVCFEMEHNVRLVSDESNPCRWTFKYESVIGYGRVEELTSPDDRATGLNRLVFHYSGKTWEFEPHELSSARIWRVVIESVTGKRSG